MSSILKTTNIKHESSSSNNLVLGSDGSATINQISSSSVFPAGGTGNPISVAVIADEQSATTAGGSSSSYNGSWVKKDLNTELSDPDSIVSIASNQFTLGAGTYLINWSSPMFQSSRHQSRLYDVTGSTVLESGSSEYNASGDLVQTRSFGSKIHTITTNNVYEIQHQTDNTKSNDGLGVESNMGIPNIYTLVTIYKLK